MTIITRYCFVKGCRHAHTHTTSYHLCGISGCNKTGHGQEEHYMQFKIDNLKTIYSNDILPEHLWCCRKDCINYKTHTTNTHRCEICGNFHCKDNCPNNKEYHNRIQKEKLDSQDTTGNPNYILACPMCKCENRIYKEQKLVYGIEQECIVCMSNKINIYLPQCGHTILCKSCIEILSTEYNTLKLDEESNIVYEPKFGLPRGYIYDELENIVYNNIKGKDGKIYIVVYAGMGCIWMLRREGIGQVFDVSLYSSDNEIDKEYYRGYRLVNISNRT